MKTPETPDDEAARVDFDRLVALAAGVAAGTNWLQIPTSEDEERREARRIARRARLILEHLDQP